MKTDPLKIFETWLKNERKNIQRTHKTLRDPFSRGLRTELSAVEKAFKAALEGRLDSNG